MSMPAQKPAQGIMLLSDYGKAKTYHIECECTDPDHAHTLDVEADEDFGVTVEIWTTAETPVWKISRWKLIWELLTKGTVKYNVALILREQQALNYAEALNKAIADVKSYKRK
jgi:hypothetical protein